MGSRPANVKTEQFDMDSFFDFNQGTTQLSPINPSSSRMDALSPYDKSDERRQFNGPSHDYNQYKQQVGLPVGSVVNMPPQMYDGYSSGIGDMGFDASMPGWSTGIDLDADMGMDFNQPTVAPMFFPPTVDAPTDNFVNPNTIGGHEEPSSNVGRLWPGMHSQQAQQHAMQKAAQTHAMQQRQMRLQAQHAQYRQLPNGSQNQVPSSQTNQSKRASHVAEPHVDESISRLLNQMRQNSSVSNSDNTGSPEDHLPHIARMKKDEEEMDEDERLLASEEGKKLSSKERRQLRNKVSARAFRSRRKEYIGQLEGEVAMKVQEANNLRTENTALKQENERYRGLIETLLRHPAFTPFINDISKDPSVLGLPQAHSQPQPHQQSSASSSQQQAQQQQQQSQQDIKPDFMNFDASQLQIPQQQNEQQQVNLAIIPEDGFAKLNLSALQSTSNFQSVETYAVTDLPDGPNPFDLLDSPLRLPASCVPSTADKITSSSATTNVSSFELNTLLANLDNAARSLDMTNGRFS
ncbi:Hypothetical protein R9X50_00630400 [Acrodontium crateriforme]|uniref:BZIP domain-containing protein n=1 Tax=Acrodontium crateriforme TaxID=150365 RepID=A0AAQ3M829_9PEZI|nr:Hypothetical protein R9X50_00630400 [Acrodontium crateriforme]